MLMPEARLGVRCQAAVAPAEVGGTWHLNEALLCINGMRHHLWRAVDCHDMMLDIVVQDRRNGSAAKRFVKRLLADLKYKPRRLVTDGLKNYIVAKREILLKSGTEPVPT
ncbi:DDE domain-containing protein [Roseomonas sp. KE2513]|nr:DDE domain-containing protein [Roseomonas sp. KE2513]